MKAINFLLIAIISLFLLIPAAPVVAQSIDEQVSELTADSPSDIDGVKEKKSDKKKKDKDIIKINDVFFISLGINIATMLLILSLIYFPSNKKMDYVFTFVLFNIVIFLLTYVLNEVKISMGAAFGLFAVFSMLRYRTAGISMKDMTYLFVFIALGLISAIQLEYYELGIINGIVVISTFVLDGNLIFKREFSKSIVYENIELIKPEHSAALLEDLRKRTGLNIHRISIGRIDFLKDTTRIKIYYYE